MTMAARAKPIRHGNSKYTDDVHNALVEARGKGMSLNDCAAYAGISIATLDNWLNDQERYNMLADDLEKARAACIARRIGIVDRAADDGDAKAAMWALQHIHGYSDKGIVQRHEHVHRVQQMDPEQLMRASLEPLTPAFLEACRAALGDEEVDRALDAWRQLLTRESERRPALTGPTDDVIDVEVE